MSRIQNLSPDSPNERMLVLTYPHSKQLYEVMLHMQSEIENLFRVEETVLTFQQKLQLQWRHMRQYLTEESKKYPENIAPEILLFRNKLLRIVNKIRKTTIDNTKKEAYTLYNHTTKRLQIDLRLEENQKSPSLDTPSLYSPV